MTIEYTISGRCNPDFLDIVGWSCQDYADKKWCTFDGNYGEFWNRDWGNFDALEVLHENAFVCPQCGCKEGGC